MMGQSIEPSSSFVVCAGAPAATPEETVLKGRYLYLLGLFFTFLQCLAWIFAAVITQFVYEELSFRSPFFMSYVGMSMLSFLLPVKYLTDRFGVTEDPALRCETFDSMDADLATASNYLQTIQVLRERSGMLFDINKPTPEKNWNHYKHMLAALHIAPIMFLADWFFNRALASTSVASATVLMSTQSVFVFLLAAALKLELFSFMKLAGVLLGILGTVLTTLQDQDDCEAETCKALMGDLFALFASTGYAAYTIQVRIVCPQDEELYSIQLLLGYIGVVCLVPLFPVAAYIALTQVQLTWVVAGALFCKGMLDFVITDYLLFRAILLTNATVATVGLGLTIPMAFVSDWLVKGERDVAALSIIGALAVSIGFLIVNLASDDTSRDKKEEELLEKDVDPRSLEIGNDGCI
jgi:solute carrier family 35 protein F5